VELSSHTHDVVPHQELYNFRALTQVRGYRCLRLWRSPRPSDLVTTSIPLISMFLASIIVENSTLGDEGKVELSIIESLNDFDELFGGEVNRNEFKVHAGLPSLPLSSFVTWCDLMWRRWWIDDKTDMESLRWIDEVDVEALRRWIRVEAMTFMGGGQIHG